jgi:threonine/homoserine/homoserine lactone efflux protein
MPDQLPAFMLVTVLLALSPGPDMALVLRNGAIGGTPAAWRTSLGCCLGISLHATAAVLGLSALIAVSAMAFTVVKIAGAVYLGYLGLTMILGTLRGQGPPAAPAASRSSYFRQGLVTNLLNPKIALLFLTLLPQFVSPGEPRVPTTLELTVAFLLFSLLWWRLFAVAVGRIGRWFDRPRVRVWVDRVTGGVLIGLGVRVALERS